jgi:hypothetical protein
MLFPASGKDKDGKKRSEWIERVGTWKYYALVLAGFDPIKADEIYRMTPPDKIAEAICSQTCYKYQSIDPPKR